MRAALCEGKWLSKEKAMKLIEAHNASPRWLRSEVQQVDAWNKEITWYDESSFFSIMVPSDWEIPILK